MVYLTGDTHGDIQRFKQGKLRWLGKKDTVVVLGDFGFVWDGSAAERKRLDWLVKMQVGLYERLFADGAESMGNIGRQQHQIVFLRHILCALREQLYLPLLDK